MKGVTLHKGTLYSELSVAGFLALQLKFQIFPFGRDKNRAKRSSILNSFCSKSQRYF